MGKLYNELQEQLKKPEHKKYAEDCIFIYDNLIKIEGTVWESTWRVLTKIESMGIYPNCIRIHKPSKIGEIFIKGILNDETKQ